MCLFNFKRYEFGLSLPGNPLGPVGPVGPGGPGGPGGPDAKLDSLIAVLKAETYTQKLSVEFFERARRVVATIIIAHITVGIK